jgi:hypothetical protein
VRLHASVHVGRAHHREPPPLALRNHHLGSAAGEVGVPSGQARRSLSTRTSL